MSPPIMLLAVLAWAAPAFEVATVKQSPPPQGDLISISSGFENGKVTMTNVSLSDCLKFAYGIVSDAQLSGPDWIKSKDVRFDIVAQASPDTSQDQMRLMLQSLLAERLNLVLHHEPRELPYLALVLGKNGPKLNPGKSAGGNPSSRGRVAANRMTMQILATLLSRFERQTIIDRTGLEGTFEFKLEWAPDDDSGPSLFTAVQEQLGLKLESRKGPLDMLVVDRAEKVPLAN